MIKGISEVRRLPRVGKIRLGIKEQGRSAQYPKAVDYFVCNADQSTPESAAKAFHDTYGDRPKVIDIMFPVEDIEKFFPQFYRRYGKSTGLLCKGDGETATMTDTETGELVEIECNPTECEWCQKGHCRPVGTLQFILPKVPILGVWQIDTTSYNSIINLNSAIDFIRMLTGGRIAMIPLKLMIRPKEAIVSGHKKTIYVLDVQWQGMSIQALLETAKKPAKEILALPELNMNMIPDDLYPAELQEQTEEKATQEQLEIISGLKEKANISDRDFVKTLYVRYKKRDVEDLTKTEASEVLERLSKAVEKAVEKATEKVVEEGMEEDAEIKTLAQEPA